MIYAVVVVCTLDSICIVGKDLESPHMTIEDCRDRLQSIAVSSSLAGFVAFEGFCGSKADALMKIQEWSGEGEGT